MRKPTFAETRVQQALNSVLASMWPIVILVVLTFAAFGGLLDGSPLSEDSAFAPDIGSDASLWEGLTSVASGYRPLASLSFAVDGALWRTAGHGGLVFTQIVIHAFNAICLYGLALAVLGPPWYEPPSARQYWAATFVAALFALHPLRVESVAWLSGRGDLLATSWMLAAGIAHVRAQQLSKVWLRAASLACLVVALLGSVRAAILPILLIVLDVYPLLRHRTHGWRKIVTEKLPHATLAISFVLIGVFGGQSHTEGGAATPGAIATGTARGAAMHVWKAVIPIDIPVASLERPGLGPALLLIAAITIAAVVCSKWTPSILAAWVAFLVALGTWSGAWVAARDGYAAGVALALLVGGLVLELVRTLPLAASRAAIIVLSAALLGLVPITRAEVTVWHDDDSRWQRAVALDPVSAAARLQLAESYRKNNQFELAIDEYRQALQLSPVNAYAEFRMGVCLIALGNSDAAIEATTHALEAAPDATWRAEAHLVLGMLHNRAGRYDTAEGSINRALETSRDPATVTMSYLQRAESHRGRDRAERADGGPHFAEAIADYRRALAIDRECLPAYVGLALTYAQRPSPDTLGNAIDAYQQALKIAPRNWELLYGIAQIYVLQAMDAAAIAAFRAALPLSPPEIQEEILVQIARLESLSR